MNIFVTGHKGLIGSNLVKQGALEFNDNLYPNLINCAGFTDVDACETEIHKSLKSNVTYPLWLAGRLDVEAHLTHISSDFIFDGARGYYSEDAAPAPLSVYGAQKWLSERVVQESHAKSLIVRTTCVFGWHPKKRTFAHWVKEQCEKGVPFEVTTAQVTTPTYAPDLARIIMQLVEQGVTGIVNVTCDRLLTRHAFARMIAEAFGYDRNLVQRGGAIQQVARRPQLGGLSCLKLEGLGITPQPFEQSLEDMVKTWGI